MLLSGVIAGTLGWEYVFYIMGGLASIWLILWVLLVADSPEEQSLISQEERDMIVTSLKAEGGGEHKEHVRNIHSNYILN